MNVLITNVLLDNRSGTETYVRDLSFGLRRFGHNVAIYSPRLGSLAEEIANSGIGVFERLEDIPFRPDVIHAHHTIEAMSAILHFSGVPAVFVCHDRVSWHDRAPIHPRIVRYVGVDLACRARIASDGVDEEKIRLIPNSVDLELFKPRAPLPEVPRRALLFSNYANETTLLPAVREACAIRGLDLVVGGSGVENLLVRPEDVLGQYDLVFGKARCGLEAMAVGCALIMVGPEGAGPMVTTENWEQLRPLNFGGTACTETLTKERVIAQIDRYNAANAAATSQMTRDRAGVDAMVEQMVGVYLEAINEVGGAAPSTESMIEEARATAQYLRNNFDYDWLTQARHLEASVEHWKASAEMAHRGWAELGEEYSNVLEREKELKAEIAKLRCGK